MLGNSLMEDISDIEGDEPVGMPINFVGLCSFNINGKTIPFFDNTSNFEEPVWNNLQVKEGDIVELFAPDGYLRKNPNAQCANNYSTSLRFTVREIDMLYLDIKEAHEKSYQNLLNSFFNYIGIVMTEIEKPAFYVITSAWVKRGEELMSGIYNVKNAAPLIRTASLHKI